MNYSVSVVAEGDREITLDEVVELADAVATLSGVASGADGADLPGRYFNLMYIAMSQL